MVKRRKRVVRRKKDPPVIPGPVIITLERFRQIEAVLASGSFEQIVAWSESIPPPKNCRVFAREAIYVICNSGMSVTVANPIYWRCVRALNRGKSAGSVFGHTGKVKAIDWIWSHRRQKFTEWRRLADDEERVRFCGELPWIGRVTKYHLAKNLGVDVVKPDVHLERLAYAEGLTALQLCQRLASETGYRVATIDTILWYACAHGVLDSWLILSEGWDTGFVGRVRR